MPDVQAKTYYVATVQVKTVLLLLSSHCLIVGIAVISKASIWPILSACMLSFLLLLTVPYNLHLLETALGRLAHGLSIEPFSSRWHWPLDRLFLLVNMLSQQTNQRAQVEQRNVAYRDQLLQQASKTAAQEERNRLARDLHDSIKQQIFGIVVSVAAIKVRWEYDPTSARKVVDDIERTALEAQVEMQALLQQLRPTALENVGLIESLRVQCQALGYRTGADVTVELDDLPPDELLPIGAQEMIFRIVQEGFTNIARHARASHVWLSLKRQEDTLLIEIGDNGQGFDVAKESAGPNAYGGMGLSNIRERVQALGGSITVWSMPNKGTTLHLCIPLVVASDLALEELANEKVGTVALNARYVLRAGMWGTELAAAFILLYTPSSLAIWPVGMGIVIGIIAWLWSQQYMFQVNINLGRKHEQSLKLLAQSYSLLAGILLLCVLYVGYFPDILSILLKSISTDIWWITPIFSILGIIALVVTYFHALQNDERYYKALAYRDLREHVQRRTQQITIDWLACIGTIGLTALHFYLFPGVSQDQPAMYIGSILLFLWIFTVIVKSVRTGRSQRMLSFLTERAIQGQRGGN